MPGGDASRVTRPAPWDTVRRRGRDAASPV